MTLSDRQNEMAHRVAGRSHPKSSARIRELRKIVKDQTVSATDKIKAIAILDRLEQRAAQKRAKRLAALPVAEPEPQVPVDPEAVAAAIYELARRQSGYCPRSLADAEVAWRMLDEASKDAWRNTGVISETKTPGQNWFGPL